MLSNIRTAIFERHPEKHDFPLKREVLTVSTLQKSGFVKKAERLLSPCNNALIALQLRPCCNAKRPSRECREALTANFPCKKRVSRKQRGPHGFS